jgi:hypothetical protein
MLKEGCLPAYFEEDAELLLEVNEGEAPGDGCINVVGPDAAEEEIDEHEHGGDGRLGGDDAEAARRGRARRRLPAGESLSEGLGRRVHDSITLPPGRFGWQAADGKGGGVRSVLEVAARE